MISHHNKTIDELKTMIASEQAMRRELELEASDLDKKYKKLEQQLLEIKTRINEINGTHSLYGNGKVGRLNQSIARLRANIECREQDIIGKPLFFKDGTWESGSKQGHIILKVTPKRIYYRERGGFSHSIIARTEKELFNVNMHRTFPDGIDGFTNPLNKKTKR